MRRAAHVAVVVLAAGAQLTPSYAATPPVELLSRASGGVGTADQRSAEPHWSRDGRFCVFASQADDLFPGQAAGSGMTNVYLYDRYQGTVELVSHTASDPATVADGFSELGLPSADGSFVVFSSGSTDIVAGQVDSNGSDDLFLWSRATNSSVLVSHLPGVGTTTGESDSMDPRISDDGRFVVYWSYASDLSPIPFDDGDTEIYLYDRLSGANIVVSHSALANHTSSGEADLPVISADGEWVAYSSEGSDLVAGFQDGGAFVNVYLWDRASDTTRLLSRTAVSHLQTGDGGSRLPAISADGAFVLFESGATNLEGVSTDTNGGNDLFLYDRVADVLRLVSHASGSPTVTANGSVSDEDLAAGGDFVAFEDSGSNLVSGQVDANGGDDIFVWDRLSGATRLVSHAAGTTATAGDLTSSEPHVAADGARVLFESDASDLATGVSDGNGAFDVYLWERDHDQNRLLSHVAGDPLTTGDGSSFAVGMDADGGIASFTSLATDLVANDGNGERDVFFAALLLFRDGFEAGNRSAWSSSVP